MAADDRLRIIYAQPDAFGTERRDRPLPGSGCAHLQRGDRRQMSTILIDKLLETVVARKASDLHITVGQPPVLRLDGRLQRLETKVLEPEDTVAPDEEHYARAVPAGVAGGGRGRLRLRVWRQGPLPCLGLQAARLRGAWCCGRFP